MLISTTKGNVNRVIFKKSSQSIHVVTIAHDTPTMTARGNRGETGDNTRRRRMHAVSARSSIRDIVVDGEDEKTAWNHNKIQL